MIEIYVYEKETGFYKYTDYGNPEYSVLKLPDHLDFTLTSLKPQSHSPQKWDGTKWVSDGLEPDFKQENQERIWEAIKQRRYVATVSGAYVASIDKVFHTDATSVIQYNNIGNMIALGNFEPIQWKVMDNTWITLTEEVYKELQTAMVQNTNRIYQVAEEHKAEMMQMDNPEDYDFSEGWDITHPSN